MALPRFNGQMMMLKPGREDDGAEEKAAKITGRTLEKDGDPPGKKSQSAKLVARTQVQAMSRRATVLTSPRKRERRQPWLLVLSLLVPVVAPRQ